uniref:Vps72/YL1 C-terminal domain-containing protein n=1 Tax=Salix viminalis TaxID=40686 RepID=A0A6N2KM20_SALVM
MEDDVSNPFRRMSMRTRKIAPRMAAALASNDNRTQPAIARLEALENDYTGMEIVEAVDDDEASLDDDDDVYIQKKQKGTKRKTRQTKALDNARKAPINFLELLHEANLEALPPHVPSYMRAAMGPPKSTWHFYTVCGFTSNYTYAKCGMPFVQSDARKYMMIPVA